MNGAAVLLSILLSVGRLTACMDEYHATFIDGRAPIVRDYSDSYKNSVYYRVLKSVKLSGDPREDMLAVARSQIGYTSGLSEDELSGWVEESGNYSEYGRYFGKARAAWCTEFACWCARQAGVPEDILKSSIGADPHGFGAPCAAWEDTVFGGGSYRPRAGDLVLFAYNGLEPDAKYLSHTAILAGDIEEVGEYLVLPTIEGNVGNMVKAKRRSVYADGTLTNDEGRVAYFIAPDYESARK